MADEIGAASAGLPLEAENGSETRAGAHVRTDVPTCRLGDRLQDICEQLDESGWDTCFVVDDRRVVLVRIGRRAIRGRADVSVEEAMTPGPSTIRPSARLGDLVERMERQKLTNLPVTTSGASSSGSSSATTPNGRPRSSANSRPPDASALPDAPVRRRATRAALRRARIRCGRTPEVQRR
jgi:CBS domain-containing protein